MKLTLQKSFRLLRFLNREHVGIVRAPVAVLASIATMFATWRIVLAKEMFLRCWHHKDFKLAARRGAWYFRRGWINIDVSQDDYFDFTEGMKGPNLDVLFQLVRSRQNKLPPVTFYADLAFIAARRFDNDSDPHERAVHMHALKDANDALLSHVTPSDDTNMKSRARKGDFPIADAQQTMADFIALFPPSMVPWFVISGTFLGLVRDKGFLLHDYDIDLGIFESQADIPALRQAILKSDRFVVKKYDHHASTLMRPTTVAKNPDVPYILKVIHVSGVHIDLFLHYRDESKTPVVDWHGTSLHRWENSAFDLARYDFYDWKLWGPADADRYLSENYGDWQTPVTDFNCTTDTPNLKLVPHPVAVVIFLKRFVLSQGKSHAAAERLKLALINSGFLASTEATGLTFCIEPFGVVL